MYRIWAFVGERAGNGVASTGADDVAELAAWWPELPHPAAAATASTSVAVPASLIMPFTTCYPLCST
jgi:hypothetical protein